MNLLIPSYLLLFGITPVLFAAPPDVQNLARIIGDIPDGTPPPPEPPKPKFIVPTKDILESKTSQEAELKAHPPKPKDIVLSFWRTESPAPTAKGATR